VNFSGDVQIRFEYGKKDRWKQFFPDLISFDKELIDQIDLLYPFHEIAGERNVFEDAVLEKEFQYGSLDSTILLDEIQIEGGAESEIKRVRLRLGEPDGSIVFDKSMSTMGDFRQAVAGRMGGVTLYSIPGEQPQLKIRNGLNHMFFIDGVQFFGDQDEIAAFINTAEIDRIDIYKTIAKVSMIASFGTGVGGEGGGLTSFGAVVSIHTRKIQVEEPTNQESLTQLVGLQRPVSARDIGYNGASRYDNLEDNRISYLYKPFFITKTEGKKVSFYTGDHIDDYILDVDGFSTSGQLISLRILVENTFN
jgi:hypothetical protein